MADYDCDFCPHVGECPWQYEGAICRVTQIKAAKAVVTEDYINVFASTLKKNGEICDERIEYFLTSMREIMHDSFTELPVWASK